MAIRRQSHGRIRADEVVHRFELRLTLGSFFSLQIRRTTTTMTVYLPGPPRPIEHWGPTADQQLEGPELDARIACGLAAGIDAEKEREKARQIHCLEPEWQNYGLIGGIRPRTTNRKES